jgi:hypothetical protein
MSQDNTAMQRFWLDNLLQVTIDGLKKPIFTAYKTRYPTSYMEEIQEKLKNNNGQYPADMFKSDDLLLNQLSDPRAWLTLMVRRWDELFQKKSGSTGKRHLEYVREIRDRWAHNRPISPDEAVSAAEAAFNLLKDFQCEAAMQEARRIWTELEQIQQPDAPKPQPVQQVERATLAQEIDAVVVTDGDTDLIQPIVQSDQLYLEVVTGGGEARCVEVPVQDGRVIIGRGERARISVDDPKVSRIHLLVTKNDTGLILTDLRSANGTMLDKKPVKPNEPTHWGIGQQVTIGNTWLILRRGR